MASSSPTIPTDQRWTTALLLSFLPFFYRGLVYASLGSWVPLSIFLGFALWVGWGWRFGGKRGLVATKVWAMVLIVWAIVRFGLAVLLLTSGIDEAHPLNQLTPWFFVASLGILLLGLYLYRGCARAFVVESSEA